MKTIAVLLMSAAMLLGPVVLGDALGRPAPGNAEAVAAAGTKTTIAPIPGTKLTAEQAQARMEKRGYTVGGHVLRDENGLWHADALKNGRLAHVMITARGKVVETKAPPAAGKPTS